MNKKIVFPVIFVALVLLGYVIGSTFLSKKGATNQTSKSSSSQNQPVGNSKTTQRTAAGITAELKAQPTVIKAAGTENLKDNLSKIDKSRITVLFSNKTQSEISGVKLSFTISGTGKYGFVGVKNVKFHTENGQTAGKKLVFDIPPISPNQTLSSELMFFASEPNRYAIQADPITAAGEKIPSEPVTVTVK